MMCYTLIVIKHEVFMKKGSTIILRAVILLIGLIALGLCTILFPIGISTDQTGWYRPLLIGLYVPAIPFFIALFQGWKLLSYIDKNRPFSEQSINALSKIKYSAVIISALFTGGMPYIFWVADKDDAPGVVAIGLIIIFAAFVIATFAAVLQKLIQNAIAIKQENELTV